MKLTLGQVQEALGLSRETYRHWQKRIFPLALRKGHGPCFSYGDLLAIALIQALTDLVAIPIGKLDPVARVLFDVCGQQAWTRFENQNLIIYPDNWSAWFSVEAQTVSSKRVVIAIPCAPVIERLRNALLIDQAAEAQSSFRFPLAQVATVRGGRQSS